VKHPAAALSGQRETEVARNRGCGLGRDKRQLRKPPRQKTAECSKPQQVGTDREDAITLSRDAEGWEAQRWGAPPWPWALCQHCNACGGCSRRCRYCPALTAIEHPLPVS